MSLCVTTPTATEFATITTNSVSTSFSDSVSTIPPTVTTIDSVSCTPVTSGNVTTSTCTTAETVSTINAGGQTTIQVPFDITVLLTQTSPTATLFSTSCTTTTGDSITTTTSTSPTTSPTTTSGATTTTTSSSTQVYTTSYTTDGSVVVATLTTTRTVVQTLGLSQSSAASSSTNVGAIVGGVVGGVVGLLLIIALGWFMVRRRHHVDEEPFFGEDKITPVLRRTDIDPDIDAEPRPYTYGTLNGNMPLATGASAVRGSTTDATNSTQPQRREPPPGIPIAAEARSPSSRSEPARSPPLTADASVTSSTGHLESPHLPLHVVNPNADRPIGDVKGAITLRPDGYTVVPGQADAEAVSPGAGSSGAAPQQVRGREPYVHQDSGRVQAAADVRAPSHSKLASGTADADPPPPAYTE